MMNDMYFDKVMLINSDGETVIFQASAVVSESRTVNYDGYNIVHMPTDMLAYRNTTSRKFSINGKLVSRTKLEAVQNAKYLNLIRKWALPGFGTTGSTPPILKFYAYRSKNIFGVPCVIRSYNWVYPDDVDYIFSEDDDEFENMPVIGSLLVEIEEAYSAEQITNLAWDIKVGPNGQFEPGENALPYGLGSQAINFTNVTATMFDPNFKGLASSDFDLPTVGGQLGTGTFSSPSDLINNPIGSLENSLITSDLSRSVVENNRFISGISPEKVNESSPSLFSTVQSKVSGAVDSFKRAVGLTPPSIIEE